MKRRTFLSGAGAALTHFSLPAGAQQQAMQTREIPATGEELGVVGLGNSVAFQENDIDSTRALLTMLRSFGGSYVDVSGASRDVVGGLAAREAEFSELFLGTYIQAGNDEEDREEATLQLRLQERSELDLVLTRLIDDYADRVDSFQRLKEEGLARLVGVARHQLRYHDRMMRLIERGAIDVLQVNYSILEPEAEARLLPMARDAGVAILVNRPFINGDYFRVVRGRELPSWAAEFDCDSWAKFSLKFILSHPAVTCVLTETSNPRHAEDNLGAGVGALPDEETRERMRRLLLSFV